MDSLLYPLVNQLAMEHQFFEYVNHRTEPVIFNSKLGYNHKDKEPFVRYERLVNQC